MGALKDDLHRLIDNTNDEKLLEGIFTILSGHGDYKEGELWKDLSEDQRIEISDSENEIGDSSLWITHEEMKNKNRKWLK